MREDNKLDYLEMPAAALGPTKTFYEQAFGWRFVAYGPEYAGFENAGLDGGFYANAADAVAKPLPILYAADLEAAQVRVEAAGGAVVRPIFSFPGGRRFHFTDPSGNELAVWSEG
jgi:predicted enzyme related to lactoylglutathione lyase